MGLHVLSLCQPTTLAQGYLIELGESVLPIKIIFQDCWLSLLDLYGQQFHPEKRPVTKEQNRRIAGILRRQIVEIPHSELEEWRG